jgi:hypothetical protein
MLSSTIKRLWDDESGFVVSSDLILVSSILVLGLLVGLVSLRDLIVQELGDVAMAVGNLNQSYSFAGHTVEFDGLEFTVAGSSFTDESDFGEGGTGENNEDPDGSEPAGISVTVEASSEG